MNSTLIYNVRIFDGESVVSSNGYILLEGGLIKALGENVPSPLPEAGRSIDGQGNTILPGLIDAHVHVYGGIPELAQAIKFGVTTLLDMMNEPHSVDAMKKAAAERHDIADLRSPLHAATVDGGWPTQVMLAIAPDKEVVRQSSNTDL
jgi:dihydroorotase-like cyclic amidohydrolase